MNLKAFEKGLQAALNKWFSGKGFDVYEKSLNIAYIRKNESVIDYVFIRTGAKSYLHELYASVSMGRKVGLIEKYWEEYVDQLEIGGGGLMLTMSIDPLDERGVSKLLITLKDDDSEAVAKAIEFVIHCFESVLSPEVETLTDIKELDRKYNDVPDSTRYGSVEMWYRKMAIAKLAGNENYRKIYNLFLTLYNGAIQTDPARKAFYEKRIFVAGEVDKKLKDVLPLEDPKAIV